jgi:hypothetical protein
MLSIRLSRARLRCLHELHRQNASSTESTGKETLARSEVARDRTEVVICFIGQLFSVGRTTIAHVRGSQLTSPFSPTLMMHRRCELRDAWVRDARRE